MAVSKDGDILRDFLWDSIKVVDHSQAARQQAKQQQRTNEIELKRNLSETNYKIAEKIERLGNARKRLVDASVAVEETVSKLQLAKQNNDSFNAECQKHRTILQNLNHTRDKNNLLKPSSDPIRKEINDLLDLLNMVEKNYQKNSFDCRLAISSLLSNQKDIELDLSSKRIAQMVDEDQLAKTKSSAFVTFKPTPVRLPEGANSDVQWNRNLDDLLNDTYSKISSASNLIKNIESFIENQSIENSSKIETLSRLLRQIYDRLNSALKNYDIQLQKVHIEIQKNEKDVNDLQSHLFVLSDSMKLVETRLENRSFHRPPIAERTIDSADQALKLERQKMLDNRKVLEDQLSSLKEARKLLSSSQLQIRNELENTKKLIDTERQCFNDLESAKDRNMMESWRKIYVPSYEIGANNYVPSYTPTGTAVADRQDDKLALTD